MTERNLSIRLSVKDHEAVKRALESMGKDGQAALQRIEQGSEPASRSLLAVNAASQEVQGGFASLAGRAGPVGNVLSALGPAGIAAAAGIGAATMAFGAAVMRAKEATEKFAEVTKTADRLGVTTTRLQELRFAAERVGIGAEAADEGLKELGIRAAEAADGSGEAVDGFKKLGITQQDLKKYMNDMPGLFELVATRLKSIKTVAEQTFIADAIFGDVGGEGLIVLLRQGADGIARLRQEAQDLGVVVEESMLRRAAETAKELQSLSNVIDVNLNQALVDLAPMITDAVSLLADFAQWARIASDGFKDFGNVGIKRAEYELTTIKETITRKRASIEAMKEQDKDYPEWAKQIFGWSNDKNIAAVEAEIAEMERKGRMWQARIDLLRGPPDGAAPPATPPTKWDGKPAGDYTKPDDSKPKTAPSRADIIAQGEALNNQLIIAASASRARLDAIVNDKKPKSAPSRSELIAEGEALNNQLIVAASASRARLDAIIKDLREPQRKMLEEQAKDVQRLIEANTKARTDQIMKIGDAIDRSLEDNLQRSAAGFQSWGDSVRAIIADVANQLIKMYMIQSTGGSIGSWIATGVNAWIGSLGGGTTPGTSLPDTPYQVTNAAGQNYFGARDYGGLTTTGGPRAAGGQVFPDVWYPTNERRAEDTSTPGWFLPVRPGVISPDSGGGSSGAVTVQQNFTLSANGAGPSEVAQLRQMVADMAVNFEARTLSALQGAKRSGKLRSMGISS